MIKNTTKKTVIAGECKKRRNILSKTFGLMLKNNITPLLFVFRREKIIPIHTLLVKKPIDLMYLDRQMKVVDIKKGLLPYRFYTPKARAMYVLELPAGYISKSRTSVGDLVNFK
ncbi:hypothetical protein GF343_00160 [Candidatus Woesearchaeota archaeon]|nr:hypothetical protein [Candidatus Woesearchaeota archaeon]